MMIGEMTSTGDVAPVMTGAPVISNPSATGAKRRIPTSSPEKQRKLRNRVAAGIVGHLEEDSRDGYVIPDDAKEVSKLEVAGDGLSSMSAPEIPAQKVKNPYSGEEQLIMPAACLVAPDVTPEAIFPLDPSQFPGGDRGQSPTNAQPARSSYPGIAAPQPAPASPTVDLMLGKSPGAQPAIAQPSAESLLSRLPGIPSASAIALEESAATASTVIAAQQPGIPMPEHRAGNASAIMDAFSQFVPRGKPISENDAPLGAPSATRV